MGHLQCIPTERQIVRMGYRMQRKSNAIPITGRKEW